MKRVLIYDPISKKPQEREVVRTRLSRSDLQLIGFLQAGLFQVYPRTREQWKDSFLVEPNLKSARVLWLKTLIFYDCCTKGKKMPLRVKQDIFEIAYALGGAPASKDLSIIETMRLKALSQQEALRYADLWHTNKYLEDQGTSK